MTALYADLSHHDWDRVKGEFNWAAVRQATSPVLCLRATYGDPAGYNPTSRHFADMALGARRAGFDTIGGYHNLIRGDQASIARQVDYLRRELDRVGAVWAMLDVERYPELVSRNLQPRFTDARAFCDRWRAVDHRVLTVYLPRWIWDGHMGRPDLRQLRSPLVASNYGSNPDGTPAGVYRARGGDSGPGWQPYGGVTPAVWQFGSNINCPGASGATDVNAFRGSLAELRALLTGEDDDMSWDQKITLPKVDGVSYSSTTRQADELLAGNFAYTLQTRNQMNAGLDGIRAELADAKVRDSAILAAVAGKSSEEVLAAIAEQGERTRAELNARAAEDAERDANMAQLYRDGQSGKLSAEQVLAKLRDLLPADATQEP